MPANRFFFRGSLEVKSTIDLKDPEHHHLRVMRIEENEEVELVNGQGSLAKARLLSLDKHKATLQILAVQHTPRPIPSIALAIPYLRASKFEFIVEKGTELGADDFYLFPADHSEKSELSDNQLERLHNLIISAFKQSGRLYLPSLQLLADFEDLFKSESALLFGDLAPTAPWIAPAKQNTLFVTGPEQGFSKKEEQLLAAQGKGVKLSANILRAETAPLAALSVLRVGN